MKIGFISLGCSKNLVDSEKIMGMLKTGGHELVNDPNEAEAIIINTCGFIESAKQEAINTILEMAEYKKGNLKKLIVVGCLAQRYKDDLEEELPEVDCFIAIREYDKLNEILCRELGNPLPKFSKAQRLKTSKKHTGYLKIAEGCSNACTYCAIPLIRGGNRSFPIEKLVEEAKAMAADGVKELVLIAQDTTKYGIDLYGELSLYRLLEEMNKIEGLHWIRVLYMYPDEIDDNLLQVMKSLDKVIPYFDIPLQHINNDVLMKMNRRGTKEDILALIDKIRETFDRPILRTTFIVGFPQESEEQFEELLEFVRASRWNSMGAFTYSDEDDTKAINFAGKIAEDVKNERLAQLMELQKEISLENNRKLIGETLEVIVEGKDALNGKYRGRSVYNAPDDVDGMVVFDSDFDLAMGDFVDVKIEEALPYDLLGKAIEKK